MKPSILLLVTTIATGTLYVLSFVALGSGYPTVESSGQDIASWFAENSARARTYAWLSALVSLGYTVFGGMLAGLLPKPHRYVFFGGVLGFAITAQVQAWFWAGLALHPQDLEPSTARVLFDIVMFWGPVVNASMVAMAAPFVLLGFREATLVPRWLAWIAGIFAVEQAIETITIFGQTGFIAPGGTMNIYLGGSLGFLFVVGAMIWGYRRIEQADAKDDSKR